MLTKNRKMRKSEGNTYNFSLPAFRSSSGDLICTKAKDCIKGCYASKYPFIIPVVNKAHNRNYDLSKTRFFLDAMIKDIDKKRKVDRIRIHDSGDFYSVEYLNKWMNIAFRFPNIEFYFYTKEVAMIKSWSPILPKNMTYILSFGGKEDHLINTRTDRHCKVFPNLEELESEGYSCANDNDTIAVGPNHKVGLVYHGVKSKNSFNKEVSYVY